MGIARMLYHQPRFAVLDECVRLSVSHILPFVSIKCCGFFSFVIVGRCTSAVSVDAEEKLYRAAMTSGTTCITVSQRLTLPEFHHFEMKVGVNEACGWNSREIEKGQKNELLSGSHTDAMHATAELH